MQKLQFFQNKVKQITIELIRNKEKETMQELENKNGIKNENLKEANDYLTRKISYLKYYKEKVKKKMRKNFYLLLKINQLVPIKKMEREISEKLKLNKSINENNEYIKKYLNQIDVKKVLDIKEEQFKLIKFEKLKKFDGFKKIIEELGLTVY